MSLSVEACHSIVLLMVLGMRALLDPEPPREPDPDLIEYVLVTASSRMRLTMLLPTVKSLVDSKMIRLLDAVVLVRGRRQPAVTVHDVGDVDRLKDLVGLIDGGVELSRHDVDLASAILEPATAALLLLIEDTWAWAFSAAARQAGGRVAGGERVVRDRYLASHEWGRRSQTLPRVARLRTEHGSPDLLSRAPAPPDPTDRASIDQAAQVRSLSALVADGALSFEEFEAQRRRVLNG